MLKNRKAFFKRMAHPFVAETPMYDQRGEAPTFCTAIRSKKIASQRPQANNVSMMKRILLTLGICLGILIPSGALRASNDDLYLYVKDFLGYDDSTGPRLSVNRKAMSGIFDTGSSVSISVLEIDSSGNLSREEYVKLSPIEKLRARFTEFPADVTLLGSEMKGAKCTRVLLDKQVKYFGGLSINVTIGWPVMQGRIWNINIGARQFGEIDEVPEFVLKSYKSLAMNSQAEVAECASSSADVDINFMRIDTGTVDGVILSPQLWTEWLRRNPQYQVNKETQYMLIGGAEQIPYVVADTFEIAGITLRNISIRPTGIDYSHSLADRGPHWLVLGNEALAQLDLVVDTLNWRLYMSEAPHTATGKQMRPRLDPYGLSLLPKGESDLIAVIRRNGAAEKAGVIDGDKVLTIDDCAVPDEDFYRKVSDINARRHVQTMPLKLCVQRNGKKMNYTVNPHNQLTADHPIELKEVKDPRPRP